MGSIIQTPYTKPPHNQQHVKKDETCYLLRKADCHITLRCNVLVVCDKNH